MASEDVRLAVYDSFVRLGRPPTADQLAGSLNLSADDVGEALAGLAAARHLVLDDAGDIVMAHPFSAIPLGFSVMGTSTLWWGGCAWDSFAMAHLLTDEPVLLVATTCPGCAAPLAWNLTREAPPAGTQVAHFLTPMARVWDDVVGTCAHQRIFCDEVCVDVWLERSGNRRGYVMDLTTLWHFASDWYTGRLDRGYVRREPSQAADYLRDVGLIDQFWGTSDPGQAASGGSWAFVPATLDDTGELFTLQLACWVQEAQANDDLAGIPPLHESLADVRASLATWSTWVVRREGRLVGSVRGRLTDDGAWDIGRLMVAPDLQGLGLGRALLEHIQVVAPAEVTWYVLFTGARSVDNLRMYRRAGFRVRPDLQAPPGAVTLTKPRRPVRSAADTH